MKLFRRIIAIFLACEFVSVLLGALVHYTENKNPPSFWTAFLIANETIAFVGVLLGGIGIILWIGGISVYNKKQ